MESASTILVYIFVFISLYFQVFLLATFFEKRSVMALEENGALKLRRYPSVTIIVPCFNEERTVSKTLFSLLKLDYPKNKLDIFIVDDGST
ncbi:MAG: glycosyltransferase, partial [Patescibacteria group bacterium]